MSAKNFARLQRVQNTLARVILHKRKFDHITPSLMELHWLPILQRVHFKAAILTYKTIHTKKPDYLFDLIRFYEPVRTLRSSSCGLLSRNRNRTVIASHAFKHSSVIIWNSIPADIRNCDSLYGFRRQLKTFLFNSAFAT